MLRDTFDRFVHYPEGQIFLLNLVDSLEHGLLTTEELNAYSASLNDFVLAPTGRPWLDSAIEPQAATAEPAWAGGERFVTVVPILLSELAPALAFDELVGENLSPSQIVGRNVSRAVFLRRETRKHTWLTDARAIATATRPDELRDVLGLDWVSEEAEVFVLEFDGAYVRAAHPRRPTGLCRGSARFRARRDDEADHASYARWGFTVDLAKWREASPDAVVEQLGGAPELIAVLGPINPSVAVPRYVGTTTGDTGCGTDSDHRRFARHLNLGELVDPDRLYGRLSRYVIP